MPSPKVPAARSLAEIPDNSAHVLDLKTANAVARLDQSGILLTDLVMVHQLIDCHQSSDTQPLIRTVFQSRQFTDLFDIDQTVWGNYLVFHQAKKIGAAGQYRRV
jgi:hypothetical protein